jgi:hypothetical protein
MHENGDIGKFDHSMLTPQTNFHFSELNFHLKRLRTKNERAPTAKLSALF